MVKMCNTHETHVIIRVPAVIITWKDAVRGESLGACHGQSRVSRRVLRVGITGNSVCLVAYHWQMDFSIGWTWLAVLRQCFSSGTAADGHTPYKARSSQNWPKITTYDHIHQIFITSCTWFRRWQALHTFRSAVQFVLEINDNFALPMQSCHRISGTMCAIKSGC